MSGPDYSHKTDAQIIAEQAASLDAKSNRFDKRHQFDSKSTALSEESGLNDSNMGEFPTWSVYSGRTPYSGGGANPMTNPPEHGGAYHQPGHFKGRPGTPTTQFEDVPAGETKPSWRAKTNPGGINISHKHDEPLRTLDAPTQPQLGEQVRQL
ncbi:hypothetical protein JCM1841_000234 [Sporobolomyces salmonicolor]